MEGKIPRALVYGSFFIRAIFVFTIIFSALNRDYLTIFVTSLALVFSFLPAMFERNYKILLPIEFEIVILIFVFASIFLGEVHSYYTRFWWWDVVLHASSGIIIGMIGFLFVYILNYEKKVKMPAHFAAIFACSFALSLGALWEIFEFTMDNLFGLSMQKNGLVDTMWDLIVDAIGALIISIGGYFYIKKVKVPLFNNMVEKFVRKNPEIFKNKRKGLI